MPLEAAAKRRRGLEMKSPGGVWGLRPQRTLSRSDQKKGSQGAKRYLPGNCKECRDYASFPDQCPLRGLGQSPKEEFE